MSRNRANKEVAAFRKLVDSLGFDTEDTADGFYVFTRGTGGKVCVHYTPSDWRWLKNTIRDMGKAGMDTTELKKRQR